jgi:hypothetical protein
VVEIATMVAERKLVVEQESVVAAETQVSTNIAL